MFGKEKREKRISEKERRIKKMFGEEKSSHVVASSKKGRKKFPVENIWPHLMRSRDWKWQKWFRHRSKKIHHVKWTPFSLVSFSRAGGKGEKSNSFRLTERVSSYVSNQPIRTGQAAPADQRKIKRKPYERTADRSNGRQITWTDGLSYERTADFMNGQPIVWPKDRKTERSLVVPTNGSERMNRMRWDKMKILELHLFAVMSSQSFRSCHVLHFLDFMTTRFFRPRLDVLRILAVFSLKRL